MEFVLPHRAEGHFMVRLGSANVRGPTRVDLSDLAFAGGNKARASNLLGMSRRNLYNRLQRYELGEANGHLNGHAHRNGRNGTS